MDAKRLPAILEGVAKEVVDLARLKVDRQYGTGTFDEVAHKATGGDDAVPNAFFARMLAKDLEDADRELKMSITVLAGASPSPSASEQISRLMGFAGEGLDILH